MRISTGWAAAGEKAEVAGKVDTSNVSIFSFRRFSPWNPHVRHASNVLLEEPAFLCTQILAQKQSLCRRRFPNTMNNLAKGDFVTSHFPRQMILAQSPLDDRHLYIWVHISSSQTPLQPEPCTPITFK